MKINNKQLLMAYLIVAHNELDKFSKLWNDSIEIVRKSRERKEYTQTKEH